MTTTRTPTQTAAQVAAEAIIDSPNDYDPETIHAVLTNAQAAGVGALYLDMLTAIWLDVAPGDDLDGSGEPDTLGPCGCVDYHMADCPLMTAGHSFYQDAPDYDPYD